MSRSRVEGLNQLNYVRRGSADVECNSRVTGKYYVPTAEVQPWGADLYTFHAVVVNAHYRAGEEEVIST